MTNPATTVTLSPQREKLIIAIVMCVVPILGMAIDLISPSLPAISHGLGVSNTISKNLVTIYLLGFGIGNLVMGILSDSFGRRKLSMLGISIFILASLLPVLFPQVIVLMVARFLQGITLGSVIILRAVLSDILDSEKLVKIAVLMATMWGIGPIVGPILGGYLQYYISWKAGFCFFALYGFLILMAILFFIPETHFKRQPLNVIQLKNNIFTILSNPLFFGMISLMGVTYSAIVFFHTLGPFFIQSQLGYSSIYFGHIAFFMGIIFLIGTTLCRYLVKSYSPEKILLYAIPSFILVGIVWLIVAYSFPYSLWSMVIPSGLLFLGCGIIYPGCMGRAMSLFRHLAGSSSALMNFVNVLITSVTAFMMSFVMANSVIPMAWIYVGLMILSGVIYKLLVYNSH